MKLFMVISQGYALPPKFDMRPHDTPRKTFLLGTTAMYTFAISASPPSGAILTTRPVKPHRRSSSIFVGLLQK